jgi:hypothetical protein
MGKFWAGFVVWWQGKKTMVGGALVAAAGIAGVAYGKLDAVTGLGVVGAGISIAGYAAKANRHQTQLLTALQDVAQVGLAARTGGASVAVRVAEGQAIAAVRDLTPGEISSAAATLHLSADSAAGLAAAVQHLAGNVAPATQAGGTAK